MYLSQCLPCSLKYAAHIVIGVQNGIGMVLILFSTMDIAYKLVDEVGRLAYRLNDQAR